MLDLSRQKESLSQMPTQTTNQLLSKGHELLQSEIGWVAKYKLVEGEKRELEEKFVKHRSQETLQAEHQRKVKQQIHQRESA